MDAEYIGHNILHNTRHCSISAFDQDLTMGVRRMRVTVSDHVVFDGQLEKGCGNQVFDYSRTIRLQSDVSDSSDAAIDSAPDVTKKQPTEQRAPGGKSVDDVTLPLELLNKPNEYESVSRKPSTHSSNTSAQNAPSSSGKRSTGDKGSGKVAAKSTDESASSGEQETRGLAPRGKPEKPRDSPQTPTGSSNLYSNHRHYLVAKRSVLCA